jgi:hypothetical protein
VTPEQQPVDPAVEEQQRIQEAVEKRGYPKEEPH